MIDNNFKNMFVTYNMVLPVNYLPEEPIDDTESSDGLYTPSPKINYPDYRVSDNTETPGPDDYSLVFPSDQEGVTPSEDDPTKKLNSTYKSSNKDFSKYNTGVVSNVQTNYSNWDILKTIKFLETGHFAKHSCAASVENALKIGGLYRFNCRENGGNGWAPALHYNGILKKHGWQLVDEGVMDGTCDHTNIRLNPGDICIQGNSASDRRNAHACLWTGKRWESDYHQNHMSAYSSHGKVKYFIYRYTGKVDSKAHGGVLKALFGTQIPSFMNLFVTNQSMPNSTNSSKSYFIDPLVSRTPLTADQIAYNPYDYYQLSITGSPYARYIDDESSLDDYYTWNDSYDDSKKEETKEPDKDGDTPVNLSETTRGKSYTQPSSTLSIKFSGSKLEFFRKMKGPIQKALQDNGVSLEFTNACLAHLAMESGYGKKPCAKNNFAGMKATKNEKGQVKKTSEVVNGVKVRTHGKFKDFDSLELFCEEYVAKIKNKFRGFDGDPSQFVSNIKKHNYFTQDEGKYNRIFMKIMNSIKI